MAHYRKAVAAAAALNSGIFAVEAVAGYKAGSLALLMDSVHNLSDEMGLVLLYLCIHLAARCVSQSSSLGECLQLGRPNRSQCASIVASDRAAVASRACPRRCSHNRWALCCCRQLDGRTAAVEASPKQCSNTARLHPQHGRCMGVVGSSRGGPVAKPNRLRTVRSADRRRRCGLVYRQHRP